MHMSRKQMEETLKSGQVVSYNGRLITDARDLPLEEEIAVTSDQKREALQQLLNEGRSLDQRIAALRQDIAETEKQEASKGDTARAADYKPSTADRAGQPVNPVTAGNVHVPITRTDANVGPVNPGQGTAAPGTEGSTRTSDDAGNDDEGEGEGEGDDKVVAGRKLSTYRKSLEKAGITNRDEAIKHLDEKYEGVGTATAEKIVDALGVK